MPDDREIIQHIDQLVDEEHGLERARGEGRSLSAEERDASTVERYRQ